MSICVTAREKSRMILAKPLVAWRCHSRWAARCIQMACNPVDVVAVATGPCAAGSPAMTARISSMKRGKAHPFLIGAGCQLMAQSTGGQNATASAVELAVASNWQQVLPAVYLLSRIARLTADTTAFSAAMLVLVSNPMPHRMRSPTAHSTKAAARALPPSLMACSE